MNDSPSRRSEVSKGPKPSPLSHYHIKPSGGSRSVASGSRTSALAFQVATGAETKSCSPASPCSASLPSSLTELSQSLAVAASSLDYISKGVDSSLSHPPGD